MLNVCGFMSSNVFEKIVNIVSKVVQILSYAMSVFFGNDENSDSPDKVD